MLTLSVAAREELDAYFAGRAKTPLRVYAVPGGCSGRRLALTVADPQENDVVVAEQGYSFCIAPDLLEQVGSLAIDLSHTGFSVNAGAPLDGSGCSGCSGCGPER